MSTWCWWKRLWAAGAVCTASAIALPAQTFTSLASFSVTNGVSPFYMNLVQGTDGNLYGTTAYGGADGFNGSGTVFRITPEGVLRTLYSFGSQAGDGGIPYSGLVLAADGSFYGTTEEGGASGGYGTVFKITSSGTLTTLHSFEGTDGAYPYSPLLRAADGNFYGTTFGGGSNAGGAVFKITPSGTLTTIYSFCSQRSQSLCLDGLSPQAGLVEAADGNFYGTTAAGGANGACTYGCGTIFKITSRGDLTTLYSFCSQINCEDGDYPQSALIQAADGNFYGTTAAGGAGEPCYGRACGTIFRITPGGRLTRLHSFSYYDGFFPTAALTQGTDGNFYGTAFGGGADGGCQAGCGTVFEMTPEGAVSTLVSFDSTDGGNPNGGLVQGTNGAFYGATFQGGSYGYGTVFSLDMRLGPFVEAVPTAGKVGKAVIILGTDLTGITSVTFNGTPAVFRVVSPSAVSTTVPADATTGKVQVVTPSGTLSSNVPFRVAP